MATLLGEAILPFSYCPPSELGSTLKDKNLPILFFKGLIPTYFIFVKENK